MLKVLQLLILCLIFAHRASAIVYYQDDFNYIDIEKWQVISNGANVHTSNGVLSLKSDGSQSFPVLISKFGELFKNTGESVLEIRFRYTEYGSMGDGISIGFTGITQYPFYQFSIWRDEGSYYVYNNFNQQKYNYCKPDIDDNETRVYGNLNIDNNWHTLIVERHSTWFQFYIDPEINNSPFYSVYGSQCNPTTLFIGNPLSAGGTKWNDIDIDYVYGYSQGDKPKVTNLPTHTLTPPIVPTNTPTPTSTPTITLAPTQTPVPTPTVVPTVVNTPTPTGKIKFILIPGMGASWSSDALVYGRNVSDESWKMTPFAKNYDQLILSLVNAGYKQNSDFWVWNYDWRKPLADNVVKFNIFFNKKVLPNDKVVIAGHSMGGVIGRLWLQEHILDDRIVQVLSVSSPQWGAIDPYTLWNGGDVSGSDGVSSGALSVLLQLHKYDNDGNLVKTVRSFVPSLKDLIPIYDFVEKNNRVLPYQNLVDKNVYLQNQYQNIDKIFSKHTALVGYGMKTPESLVLGNRTSFDKMFGYWPDGRLLKVNYGDGDDTVSRNRQSFDGDTLTLYRTNHGSAVKNGSLEILKWLGIGTTTNGGDYELKKKKIIFVGSPAKVKADCGMDGIYESDEQGFLILEKSYRCKIFMVGTGSGRYHLVIGDGGKNNKWNYVEGEINLGQIVPVDLGNKQFWLELIKQDLLLIGLGKEIQQLNNGRYLDVLKVIMRYRAMTNDLKTSDRLIDYLEKIIEAKDCFKFENNEVYFNYSEKVMRANWYKIETLKQNFQNYLKDKNLDKALVSFAMMKIVDSWR